MIAYGASNTASFFDRVTGRENLLFFGALYNLGEAELGRRIATETARLGLSGAIDREVRTYSDGMRQRLALARALVTDATVWLLDEPTRSLNPSGRLAFGRLLRTLARDRGLTMVMATHDLAEAAACCDDVCVIADGRIRASGPPAALEAEWGSLGRAYQNPYWGPNRLVMTLHGRLRLAWWKARVVFWRDLRTDLSYRVSFVLDLVNGLVFALSYMFLAVFFGNTRPDGYDALGFLIVGMAANGAMTSALLCFAQAVRGADASGAIKAVLVTPTAPATFLLLGSLYPLCRAALDAVVLLGSGWLFGLSFGRANWPGAVVVFVLGAMSMATFGVLSAACALVLKRGDPVVWLLGAANWLLSGVVYPTAVLPPLLRRLSDLLPATHVLKAMRALLLEGAPVAAVAPHLWFLLAFAGVGVPASLWVVERAILYAKREGTLGQA